MDDCVNQARTAIKTIRTRRTGTKGRDRLYSIVDYDDRDAPKSSKRYCMKCAKATMDNLLDGLVNSDEEMPVEEAELADSEETEAR